MLGSMKVVGAVGAASVALAALYWRRRVMPIGPCAADGRPLPSGDQQVMLSGNGLTRYHLNIRWLKEGECIVVLIHGMTSPGVDVWRPLIACLEARRRCVLAYDVAGRGWSHCAGGPMTIGYHVRQLEELLDTLSIGDRPLELVGLSFGAVIASNFAVRHRDRVRRLVMIAPAGLFPPRDYLGLLAGSGLLGLLARVRWAARCRASLKRDYARELRAMTDGGAVLRAYIANADCNRAIVRSYLSTLLCCAEVFDNRRALRALGSSSCQTLLLFAERDSATGPPPDDAELRELLPTACWHRLDAPGLDHAMHLTHRHLVEPLIADFVGSDGERQGRATQAATTQGRSTLMDP
ncbi:hypothetical protein EMIHUDRAFT_234206 [Emiliania huxleyi CCMP1516]|uniref:AB hydrolase-1 domain-containing protein n=2 Tax=Emiliania huxleyi TaxID=2903 RepID=A0A0D3JZS3_EMIH1|nr:hypothetical protein EMIHUDRAFT_234206 [Emiliania huxleyi CCMP1516]EOD29008.1 hypothetical protein EMIHUDRAFT_234206 [Emiliania huxleyi CCMP1516]|eukprot:XP_005781437.1 hypothetical protein EMIHUDRAFT_234206 [Emiliania huxleyi CCMP1516]